MSGRTYLRALVVLALANYLAIPGALTVFDLFGVLPMAARAAYLPPAVMLSVALAAALIVRVRAGETGAHRLWAVPIFLWVVAGGPFQASAPVSVAAMIAAGHPEVGFSMLSAAIAPVAVLLFVGVYRPPPQRWLGQRPIAFLVVLAVLADLCILLPRFFGRVGAWLGMMALNQPAFGRLAGDAISLRFALAPMAERLAALDLAIAGLPFGVHTLVLVGGLVMLAVEGEWRPIEADFALPHGDRR